MILTERRNHAIAMVMIDTDPQYPTTIAWSRGERSHHKGKYSRGRSWHFAGGVKLEATNSMALEGCRDEIRLHPESLFVRTSIQQGWCQRSYLMRLLVTHPTTGIRCRESYRKHHFTRILRRSIDR
jgi:hypothetical protein